MGEVHLVEGGDVVLEAPKRVDAARGVEDESINSAAPCQGHAGGVQRSVFLEGQEGEQEHCSVWEGRFSQHHQERGAVVKAGLTVPERERRDHQGVGTGQWGYLDEQVSLQELAEKDDGSSTRVA